MPFRVDDDVVTLDGHCTVEEAQALFEALRDVERPVFDLTLARSMHTAIVQLVLASQGAVRSAPTEPVLAACFRGRALG